MICTWEAEEGASLRPASGLHRKTLAQQNKAEKDSKELEICLN
jgi:hypothetical protein